MQAARKHHLPIFEMLGAILIALVLLLFVMLLINLTRPAQTPTGLVTAILTVIPAPTETPTPPAPANTPTPQDDVPQSPGAGVLYVGAYVQVAGTGGDGLRIRSGPGLSYDQQYLGLESEVFEIIAGPQDADGYTWWHLSAPYDANINGWAVSNYLEVVDEP
jgi:hypothetical protein